MAIGAATRNDYSGNGSTGTYSYTFKIFAQTDLKLIISDSAGAETPLTITTHYTVTGVGLAAGGTIVLVAGSGGWLDSSGFLKSGYTLSIERNRAISQTTDLRNQSSFLPEVHEDTFDHIVMLSQRLNALLQRAVRVREGLNLTTYDLELPQPAANKALGWDATGKTISNLDTSVVTPVTIASENVTFLQAGAGGVSTSVRARLREYVSITDFGAVADGGVTDNATALANALAHALATGKAIYVPGAANYYGTSATWALSGFDGVRIFGDGPRSMLATKTANHVISLTNCDDFRIEDIAIGSESNNTGIDGIRLVSGSARGYIKNVFCKQFAGRVIHLVAGGLGLTIDTPKFSTNLTSPFTTGLTTATPARGILIDGAASNNAVTCIGPIIEGMTTGVEGLSGFEGFYCLGGTVEGNGDLATEGNFKFTGAKDVVILGTYQESTGASARGIIFDACRNCLVSGGRSTGTVPAGKIELLNACIDITIEHLLCDSIDISAASKRTILRHLNYGNATGGITNLSDSTIIEDVSNSSDQNVQTGGRTRNSHVNYVRNGGFERWLGASGTTILDDAAYGGFSPVGVVASMVRTGDGESDTTKFQGHYALKLTAGAAEGGLQYQGVPPRLPDVANNPNAVVTITVWIKTDAGTTSFDLRIVSGGGIVDTQSFTATTTWTKFAASFPMTDLTANVRPEIRVPATKVLYIDALSFTLGDARSTSEFDNLKNMEPEPQGCHIVTSSATPTFYHDVATLQAMVLTANVTGITLSNPLPGLPLYIRFKQDGTGGRTVAGWPATVKWAAGSAPTITVTADKSDVVGLIWDGTNWWQIALVQNM